MPPKGKKKFKPKTEKKKGKLTFDTDQGKGILKQNSKASSQRKKDFDAKINKGCELQEQAATLQFQQKMGALTEAEQHYSKVLQASPLHLDALYNLGTCLIEQAEALDDLLEKKSEAHSQNLTSSDNCVLERENLLDRAMDMLRTEIAADTSNRGEATGLSHKTLGQLIGARIQYWYRDYMDGRRIDFPAAQSLLFQTYQEACGHFQRSAEIFQVLRGGEDHLSEIFAGWASTQVEMMELLLGEEGDEAWVQSHTCLSTAMEMYTQALNQPVASGESDLQLFCDQASAVQVFLEAYLEKLAKGMAPLPHIDTDALLAVAYKAVDTVLALHSVSANGLLLRSQLLYISALMQKLNLDPPAYMSAAGSALEAFNLAVQSHPNDVDILAAASEFLFEHGKTLLQMQSGDGEQTKFMAQQYIQEAQRLCQQCCQANPQDLCLAYNRVCIAAVLCNFDACKESFTRYLEVWDHIQQKCTMVEKNQPFFQKELVQTSLPDLLVDEDLSSMKHEEWFQQIVVAHEGKTNKSGDG